MIAYKVDFEIKDNLTKKGLSVISEFVKEVHDKEPGTIIYHSFQWKDNPRQFTHYMVFRDEESENLHKTSAYCLEFVNTLYPICSKEPVFTSFNYIM